MPGSRISHAKGFPGSSIGSGGVYIRPFPPSLSVHYGRPLLPQLLVNHPQSAIASRLYVLY